MPLTADDIKVGHWYRAKRPRRVLDSECDFNDRYVLWVCSLQGQQVQYDGPAVRFDRHYPHVPMEVFLKWADHEVMLQKGEEA